MDRIIAFIVKMNRIYDGEYDGKKLCFSFDDDMYYLNLVSDDAYINEDGRVMDELEHIDVNPDDVRELVSFLDLTSNSQKFYLDNENLQHLIDLAGV